MKSTHKVERFDYSKDYSEMDYQYWGIHTKNGRIHIDTKRYKKACEINGVTELLPEFMPEKMFANRSTTYFIPKEQHRYDYKFNIFRDLINELKDDWFKEYRQVFERIKTPNQVRDEVRIDGISGVTTDMGDALAEAEANSWIAAIKRESKYIQITNSLYFQFISNISAEIDRYVLIVVTKLGYEEIDFSVKEFRDFSYKLGRHEKNFKFNSLSEYENYDRLHKINNFLKHNSIKAYNSLKKYYPSHVRTKENKTANIEYENGMIAGNWIIIEEDYIDGLFDKLLKFFEAYCQNFLGESTEDSDWNYDDFFKKAYRRMRYPETYPW